MMQRTSILAPCFLLALLMGPGFSTPAFAQLEEEAELNIGEILMGEEEEEDEEPINQYDEKYKPLAAPKKDDKKDKAFTAVNGFVLNFVRDPAAGADEAVLQISQPVSVNGCLDITMEPPLVEYRGAAMTITVKQPKIVANKRPQYSAHGCRMKMTGASANVKLNRADISEQGIKQVAFKLGGAPDIYLVEATRERLSLIPKSSHMFKPNTGAAMADPLTYWFFPADTVILVAPRAISDVTEEISKLAHTKGMVGMEHTLAGFEQPPGRMNKLYFIDQTGSITRQMGEGNSTLVGQVPESRTYRGAQGAYEKETGIDVLAYKPRALE